MRNSQILRFIVIIGIAVHLYSGSTAFTINNGFLNLEMNWLSLVSYPFFVFSVWYSLIIPPSSTGVVSPWWRGFVAFLIDFITILNLIGIPLCFLGLIIENNGFPHVWSIARELNSEENLLYSVILLPSILLMIGLLSLALHPKIVSPGALVANVSVTTKIENSNTKLAIYGFLSYFLIAFPFIKHLIVLKKEKEQLEPVVVLRNA